MGNNLLLAVRSAQAGNEAVGYRLKTSGSISFLHGSPCDRSPSGVLSVMENLAHERQNRHVDVDAESRAGLEELSVDSLGNPLEKDRTHLVKSCTQ